MLTHTLHQEWHSTKDRTARGRAAQLRKLGYNVTSSQMGHQMVNGEWIGKRTMLTVSPGIHADLCDMPFHPAMY
jgi:hypothetical protein